MPSAIPLDVPADALVANLKSIDVDLLRAHDAGEYQRLLQACEEYGFFYLNLVNHRTMLQDWKTILGLMEEYFALPLEVKMKECRKSDTHGYDSSHLQ
jgi:isopenicillin N synthase-like dioxygenase